MAWFLIVDGGRSGSGDTENRLAVLSHTEPMFLNFDCEDGRGGYMCSFFLTRMNTGVGLCSPLVLVRLYFN
jgi:hypothetical protein